ncbi:MAG: hypothetical protein HRU19_22955 [Pseudobacteriovorax sp.]|nr:hypothetical protein [Pseudobacteriovorax sp.]
MLRVILSISATILIVTLVLVKKGENYLDETDKKATDESTPPENIFKESKNKIEISESKKIEPISDQKANPKSGDLKNPKNHKSIDKPRREIYSEEEDSFEDSHNDYNDNNNSSDKDLAKEKFYFFSEEALLVDLTKQLENIRSKDQKEAFRKGQKVSKKFVHDRFLGSFQGEAKYNGQPFTISIDIEELDGKSEFFIGHFSLLMEGWNNVPKYGISEYRFDRLVRHNNNENTPTILINFSETGTRMQAIAKTALQLVFLKESKTIHGNFYFLEEDEYIWQSTVTLNKINEN